MENNQEPDIQGIRIDLKELHTEIEEKKEDLVNKLSPENVKIASEESKDNFGEVIGDLFYHSVKNFFDMGFKLAKNLNLEFFTKENKQVNKDQKE